MSDVKIEPLKYGSWTVLEEAQPYVWKNKKFKQLKCRCDCGEIQIIRENNLKSGQTTRCKQCYGWSKLGIELGAVFGTRTVVDYPFIGRVTYRPCNGAKTNHYYVKTECTCGTIEDIEITSLKRSPSCRACGQRYKPCGFENKNWTGYGEISGSYFSQVQRGAAERGISFELTIEYMWDLYVKQGRVCALTGRPIAFNLDRSTKKNTASLDRIDSSKDYTVGNVQWVHKDINKFKLGLQDDELFDVCFEIVSYVLQKKGKQILIADLGE